MITLLEVMKVNKSTLDSCSADAIVCCRLDLMLCYVLCYVMIPCLENTYGEGLTMKRIGKSFEIKKEVTNGG